jgi:hypothetical protein
VTPEPLLLAMYSRAKQLVANLPAFARSNEGSLRKVIVLAAVTFRT